MMNTRHCHDEHKTLPNRNKKTIFTVRKKAEQLVCIVST